MCHCASLGNPPPSSSHFFLWGRSCFLLSSDRHEWHSAQIPVALPLSPAGTCCPAWELFLSMLQRGSAGA